MPIVSLAFIGSGLLIALLYHALWSDRARAGLMHLANFAFIATFLAAPQDALPLAAFLALSYAATLLVSRFPNPLAARIAILGLVLLFAWLKDHILLGFVPRPIGIHGAIAIVGLSYMLFRVLHLIMEVAGGDRPRPHFGVWLRYTVGFHTLASGPIQLFGDWEAMQSASGRLGLDRAAAQAALWRVARGVVRVAVLGAIAHDLHGIFSARLPVPGLTGVAFFSGACGTYLVYLYLSFAGSMDIVLGLARLMGWTLPENFNHPFKAQNFPDFWGRWHISLSDWFKRYLLPPLLQSLMRRVRSKTAMRLSGVVAIALTFGVMGMWHGTTPIFLAYGAFLGVGVGVHKMWQVALRRKLGKKRTRALQARVIYRRLSQGLTVAWFAFSLAAFWTDWAGFETMARALGPLHLALVLVVLIAASAAALIALDGLQFAGRRLFGRIGANPHIQSFAFALTVIMAFALLWLGTGASTALITPAF